MVLLYIAKPIHELDINVDVLSFTVKFKHFIKIIQLVEIFLQAWIWHSDLFLLFHSWNYGEWYFRQWENLCNNALHTTH